MHILYVHEKFWYLFYALRRNLGWAVERLWGTIMPPNKHFSAFKIAMTTAVISSSSYRSWCVCLFSTWVEEPTFWSRDRTINLRIFAVEKIPGKIVFIFEMLKVSFSIHILKKKLFHGFIKFLTEFLRTWLCVATTIG